MRSTLKIDFISQHSPAKRVVRFIFTKDNHSASSVIQWEENKQVIMSDNYLMLDENAGMFSFPSTRPTTPGQSSGPSYGPVQVLVDDNPDPPFDGGRRPSRGGSRSRTPNADLLDVNIRPNTQGFPVDSVCALTS